MGRRVEGSSGDAGTGGCCCVVDDVPPGSGRPHDSSIRSWMPARVAASSLLHGRSPPTTSCSSWNNKKNYRQNKQEHGTSPHNWKINNFMCSVVLQSKRNDNPFLMWWSHNATSVAYCATCNNVKIPNATMTREIWHRTYLKGTCFNLRTGTYHASGLRASRRFRKIAKQLLLPSSCLSVCLSIRLSVRTEQLGSHWTDFQYIWYSRIFRKSVEKIQV